MHLIDESIQKAYEEVILKEASNRYVKYFEKDKKAFKSQFTKHDDALSKGWLPYVMKAYDKIIKAVSNEDDIDIMAVGEGIEKIKGSLRDLEVDTGMAFKALNLRHINALATQWITDIKKDYGNYVKKNFNLIYR